MNPGQSPNDWALTGSLIGLPTTLLDLIQQCHTIHNSSQYFEEVNPNCPTQNAHSVIAYTSIAVASVVTLIHLCIIALFHADLVPLYGAHLCSSILVSLLQNVLLFTSLNLQPGLSPADIPTFANTTANLSYNKWSQCALLETVLHHLSICSQLALLLGFIERYTYFRNQLDPDHFQPIQSKSNHAKELTNSHRQLSSNNHSNLARFQPSGQGKSVDILNHSRFRSVSWLYIRIATTVLIVIALPLIPVSIALYATLNYPPNSSLNPMYGSFSCGNIGLCLLAYQWLLYLPLGCIYFGQLCVLISTRKYVHYFNHFIIYFTPPNQVTSKETGRLHMLMKQAGSQFFVWLVAFTSNYLCISALWQLFSLVSALQTLFFTCTCIFSRPLLEIMFKRNDSLGRLKLDRLIGNMPLGVPGSSNRGSSTTSTAQQSSTSVRGTRYSLAKLRSH